VIAVGCEAHYQALVSRINSVTRDKWPEALTEDAMPFDWARESAPELARRYESLEKESNELWLNGRIVEFKKMSTEWGTTVLQIMKQYAAHLRHREAA
jgi:hypothetical protein